MGIDNLLEKHPILIPVTSVPFKTIYTKGILDLASLGGGIVIGYMDAKGNGGGSTESYLTYIPAGLHTLIGGAFGFFSDFLINIEDSDISSVRKITNGVVGAGLNTGVSLLETKIGYYIGKGIGSIA